MHGKWGELVPTVLVMLFCAQAVQGVQSWPRTPGTTTHRMKYHRQLSRCCLILQDNGLSNGDDPARKTYLSVYQIDLKL